MSDTPRATSDTSPGRRAPEQRLWALWREGLRPDVRAFLAEHPGLTPEQVAGVLAVDQYERWSLGQRVSAEDYLSLAPELGQSDQAACDVVYGEYLLREQLGESPSLADYQRRFPHLAALLERQVELHRALGVPAPADGPPTILGQEDPTPGGVPRVPGYEVLGELGRGGMGVVLKARQISLNRVVALKVLRLDPASAGITRERMRREAQVTARLGHPHVVTIFDAGQAGDRFFFAMEYVAGVDLHRLVERFGPLPVPVACEYVRQAALGLQHAFEQGLVHRDIKPSNLIVTLPGSAGPDDPAPSASDYRRSVLKVLDLGLARLSAVEAPGDVTQVGTFVGTPDFVAPEQASNARAADVRSDLYSLGCTFYYLLTASVPFPGGTVFEKLLQHRLEEPQPVSQRRPEVPPAVEAVVRKLMAKRPQDRYQTPGELAQDLTRVLPMLDSAEIPGALRDTPTLLTPPPASPSGTRSSVLSATTPDPALVRRFTGHTDWVKSVAFSPDGRRVASGGLDRTVRLWDSSTGGELWCRAGQAGAVVSVTFSPDGRRVLSGGEDGSLWLWDAEGGKEEVRLAGHERYVNSVAFSPGGERALSGGHDGTVRLWDVETGKEVRTFTGHGGPVWSVAFSPDGRHALSGSQDRTVRLWDLATGQARLCFAPQRMAVTSVAFSPDGRLALAAGTDALVHVWDRETGVELHALEGHTGKVTCACFSPDGQKALSGSRDGTARLWDVLMGRELACFVGHSHWVTGVAFAPQGGQAVSGSADRALCLWKLPGGTDWSRR